MKRVLSKEFCPFHENTGFTLTLLEKDPQRVRKIERLFLGANLVVRPAKDISRCNV